MRYLKIFEEFVETPQNTEVLYKDSNLVVKVAKTFDSAKNLNKDTSWCSTSPRGFYSHNRTSNMYRIEFKDGYKLRLTWDYINQKASELGQYSGGTHWGQGGLVDGEYKFYDVFRPRDEENPFEIDWKSDRKREIVERILSIPDDAKLAMMDYQDKLTKKKSENLIRLYKEIEQIKVTNVKRSDQQSSSICTNIDITISYRGKIYQIELEYHNNESYYFKFGKFEKDFKNRYFQYGKETSRYLYDKTMEYIKKHDLDII